MPTQTGLKAIDINTGQKGTVDITRMIQEENPGSKIIDINQNTGIMKIKSPEGEEGEVNLNLEFAERGLKLTQEENPINTPETAFDNSPLSLKQRGIIGLGTSEAGQVREIIEMIGGTEAAKEAGMNVDQVLQNMGLSRSTGKSADAAIKTFLIKDGGFENAKKVEGEWVVKQNNKWLKANKDGLDTGDVMQFAGEAAINIIGAIAGGALGSLGGPVGGGIGAFLGSAGAEKLEQALAQQIFTSNIDPNELQADLATEVIFAAAGETPRALLASLRAGKAVSNRVLATLLARSTGNGLKTMSKATPKNKQKLAAVLSAFNSNMDANVTSHVISDATTVVQVDRDIKRIAEQASKLADEGDIQRFADIVRTEQVEIFEKYVKTATQEASNKFARLEKPARDMLKSGEVKLEFNLNTLLKEIREQAADNTLDANEKMALNIAEKKLIKQARLLGSKINKNTGLFENSVSRGERAFETIKALRKTLSDEISKKGGFTKGFTKDPEAVFKLSQISQNLKDIMVRPFKDMDTNPVKQAMESWSNTQDALAILRPQLDSTNIFNTVVDIAKANKATGKSKVIRDSLSVLKKELVDDAATPQSSKDILTPLLLERKLALKEGAIQFSKNMPDTLTSNSATIARGASLPNSIRTTIHATLTNPLAAIAGIAVGLSPGLAFNTIIKPVARIGSAVRNAKASIGAALNRVEAKRQAHSLLMDSAATGFLHSIGREGFKSLIQNDRSFDEFIGTVQALKLDPEIKRNVILRRAEQESRGGQSGVER